MKRSRLKQVNVGVYHHNCHISESTEKFPEIKVSQASAPVMLKKGDKQVKYQILWDVEAPDRKALDEYLNYMKNRPDMLDFFTFNKSFCNARMFVRVVAPHSTYERSLNSGVVLAAAVDVQKGFEIYPILTDQISQVQRTLEELKEIAETKVLKVTNVPVSNLRYELTDRQLLALKLAHDNGYYSWPRQATLEDLSLIAGLTRRGYQEHLRKAESKLFPKLLKHVIAKKGN